MKFSAREDIDAPIENVYVAVTDFESFERKMLRRGVEITRDDSVPLHEVGSKWTARFDWRGRRYDMDGELVVLEPGEGFSIASRSNGIDCLAVVDLMALSQTRTRMFVSIDLKPSTLSARLLLQSLRIAKGSLSTRFKARVSEFAKGLQA